MATEVKGRDVMWGGKASNSYYYYTTSSTNTTYSITVSEAGVLTRTTNKGTFKLRNNGTDVVSTTFANVLGKKVLASNRTITYTRTHVSQSKNVDAYAYFERGDTYSLARKTFTIPARPSYTVTYNANSGSGAPANQTKWYDETLQISPTKPTKSGYIFRGWATSQANANAGTVSYAAGANYTGNAALTLYAVWELAYTSPIINQLIVERCKSDGTDSDEGTYARISFDWSVYINDASRYYGGTVCPYTNSVADITIKVGEITKTISSTTSTSINEIIDTSVTDPFNVDVEYPVSITVADTRADVSNNTKTVTSRLLTPIFILDANADATAVGILKSAPDDGQGVYLGGDVHAEGNTGYFEELFVKKDADSSGGKKIGEMKTLLTTASYMGGNQDLTFSEPVSEQLTGIVLVWSWWSGSQAEDWGWRTFFIPKAMVQLHDGVGYDCPLSRPKSSYFGHKYVYIHDTHIVGHADNIATGTANGVPYANNKWVLRYVFGC